MRTLYYVPIIHIYEELGTIGPLVKEVEQQMFAKVQNLWLLVAERLAQAPLRYDKLYIYMDSLPTKEEAKNRIYEDHVQRQFPIYLIIDGLVSKGAKLMGTESLELLRQEVNHWQEVAQLSSEQTRQSKEEAKGLLQKRDTFIAQRINETLPDEYQAVLFMGRAHKVIEELDVIEEAGGLKYPLRVVYL